MTKLLKFKTEDILYLARLADLDIVSKEAKKLARELTKIVGYFESLKKVDTKGIGDAYLNPSGLTNIAREDRIDLFSSLSQEEAVFGTERIKNGFFVSEGVIRK